MSEQLLMTVVGITCRTQNLPGKSDVDIPALWEQFFTQHIVDKIPHRLGGEVVAVYFDYDGDHTQPYTLLIGCPIEDGTSIPEGLEQVVIPKGDYATFKCTGPMPETLVQAWQEVWQSDIKRTYQADFEVYPAEHWSALEPTVDLYVGISP